jgi:hypothetical protein
VINIELLIKNPNSGGSGGQQARKRQILTSRQYGVGKSKGN